MLGSNVGSNFDSILGSALNSTGGAATGSALNSTFGNSVAAASIIGIPTGAGALTAATSGVTAGAA